MQNNKEVVSGAADERIVDAVMANLSDRSGVFDGIEDDVMQEIRESLRADIAALQPAQTAPMTGAEILDLAARFDSSILPDIMLKQHEIILFARALLASQPTAAVSDARMLGYELEGVIIDVEQGHGFDDVCLSTIKRVRALLSHPAAPAQPTPAVSQQIVQHVCDAFGIGDAARTLDTIMVNVQNAKRRADCLAAIEREFFMVPGDPDDDYPDDEPADECLLNWGSDPAEYVEQFRSAIAHLSAPAAQQPNNYHDAYRGARDDLLQWKRRALEAEESCRRLTDALNTENGPTHIGEPVLAQQPSDFDSKAQRAEAWYAVVAALNAAKPDWMENNLSGMGAAIQAIKSATWQQPSETAINYKTIEALQALAREVGDEEWFSVHHGVSTDAFDREDVCRVSSTRGNYELEERVRNYIAAVSPRTILSLLRPAAQEAEKPQEPKRETIKIEYQRGGRFWHTDCTNHLGGVMRVVSHEADGSTLECGHCGKRGAYPVGSVGEVVCEAQEAAREQPAKGEK